MNIAGVDEAGRGCVIGPMVVAGVCIDSNKEVLLRELGVKDSKLLSPHKRNVLFLHILRHVKAFCVFYIGVEEIDAGNLNELTLQADVKIVRALVPDIAYIDAPASGKGLITYNDTIQSLVEPSIKICAENKADQNYVVVSAASIVAKVLRDHVISGLRQTYGDFGSGYPSDPKTVSFLKKCTDEQLRQIARLKWSTIAHIRGE